jgi:putative sterol carrier protein
MGEYEKSDEVYDLMGSLLTWATQQPNMTERLAKAGLSMKMVLHDPEAILVVNCKNGGMEWSKGEWETPADIEVGMSTATAHKFFMNKLNLLAAVALREVVLKGSVTRMMGMIWALKPLSDQYVKILKEKGRDDLLE